MNALYTDSLAMQRGYIILIAGAVLLISGIVISIFWAGSFAGTIIRENTILSGVSIRSAGSVNASTQVIDTSRPVSLAIHVERNNSRHHSNYCWDYCPDSRGHSTDIG